MIKKIIITPIRVHFVDLRMLNIFASFTFSLSIILIEILAKNGQNKEKYIKKGK